MFHYIYMVVVAVTLAATTDLRKVNETCTKIRSKGAELFHHNPAKLLFLCTGASPVIQIAL